MSKALEWILRMFFPARLLASREYGSDAGVLFMTSASASFIVGAALTFLVVGLYLEFHLLLAFFVGMACSNLPFAIACLLGVPVSTGSESVEVLNRIKPFAMRAVVNLALLAPFVIYLGSFTLDRPYLVLGLMLAIAANGANALKVVWGAR